MIDLTRIDAIIAKKIKPESRAEQVMLAMYELAALGNLFFTSVLTLGETLDKLTAEELHYLILGYALGQKDLEELEAIVSDPNTTFH